MHKPQVYIDLSGWSPKYFPPQLVHYANTLLRNQVLFGTDYPFITPDRWLADFDTLDIKPRGAAADPEGERRPAARASTQLAPRERSGSAPSARRGTAPRHREPARARRPSPSAIRGSTPELLEVGGGGPHLVDPPRSVGLRAGEQALEQRLADHRRDVGADTVLGAGCVGGLERSRSRQPRSPS